MRKDLNEKVVLIIGSTSELGYCIAKVFAEINVGHLILLSRSIHNLQKLDDYLLEYDVPTTLVPLDITDFSSLDQLSIEIQKRFGRLDILISNISTVGSLTLLTHLSLRELNSIMSINFSSNWYLLKSLESSLKYSCSPKIVFISSDVNLSSKAYWGAYSASRSALESMVNTYRLECKNTSNISINIFNPGNVRTSKISRLFPGVDSKSLVIPELIIGALIDVCTSAFNDYKISVC
jgi:short-subunit dehydrogenase